MFVRCPPVLSNARQTRKHILNGVLSCSARFLHSPMHAKHENTLTLVCFRVRHVFYALECTLSMKQHPDWCFFMFDAFPVPSNVRRARNHTLTGVFSCSAPVLYLRMQQGGFSPPRCCIF